MLTAGKGYYLLFKLVSIKSDVFASIFDVIYFIFLKGAEYDA